MLLMVTVGFVILFSVSSLSFYNSIRSKESHLESKANLMLFPSPFLQVSQIFIKKTKHPLCKDLHFLEL